MKSGALPPEEAQASLRAFKSAKAALAEAESRLAKSNDLSPVDGTVLERFVEPGQHVLPGQPLLLLATSDLEIHAEVVEEDLRKQIRVGAVAFIRTSEEDGFSSEVTEVAPAATGPSRTFTVKIAVPAGREAELRVGGSVRVDFVVSSCSQCLAVPVEAIHLEGGRAHVYFVRDGRAYLQPVDTGVEDGGLIEVAALWNGRDPVAVSNLAALADSLPVLAVEVFER